MHIKLRRFTNLRLLLNDICSRNEVRHQSYKEQAPDNRDESIAGRLHPDGDMLKLWSDGRGKAIEVILASGMYGVTPTLEDRQRHNTQKWKRPKRQAALKKGKNI